MGSVHCFKELVVSTQSDPEKKHDKSHYEGKTVIGRHTNKVVPLCKAPWGRGNPALRSGVEEVY